MLQFTVPQVELLGVSEAAVLRGLQMLDRRLSHGMVYLSCPPRNNYQANLYLLKFMLHEYMVLLLPLHSPSLSLPFLIAGLTCCHASNGQTRKRKRGRKGEGVSEARKSRGAILPRLSLPMISLNS